MSKEKDPEDITPLTDKERKRFIKYCNEHIQRYTARMGQSPDSSVVPTWNAKMINFSVVCETLKSGVGEKK